MEKGYSCQQMVLTGGYAKVESTNMASARSSTPNSSTLFCQHRILRPSDTEILSFRLGQREHTLSFSDWQALY